jgi:tRNA A37 threonylcarbamoyltransferase TsaD
MTVPPTSRISKANGWLEVFNSASKPTGERANGKEIARQFKGVSQTVAAGQPERNDAGNRPTDEARLSRNAQIFEAIKSIPLDMAPGLKPQLSAFLTMGVSCDDALQYSLTAIDHAAKKIKAGDIDAARVTLVNAISQLAPVNQAGGHTPPATQPAVPEGQARAPGE